jgi:hypothetical protein
MQMVDYSKDPILKDYRYIVAVASDLEETMGAYNDLGLAVDQLWRWFREFPGKYVVVDTKNNTQFTITVTR